MFSVPYNRFSNNTACASIKIGLPADPENGNSMVNVGPTDELVTANNISSSAISKPV